MIPAIIPVVGIALVAGAAIGAVFSLAYTIPQHKDGRRTGKPGSEATLGDLKAAVDKGPEKLSQPERTHTAWGEKRWGKH